MAKNIENNFFVKLLLVETSEPRVILVHYLKFSLFKPGRCSSAVGIFQGFSNYKLSVFIFLKFGIICFLETPLRDCFVPLLLVFRKLHSIVVIDVHNSDLFKLLVRIAAINFPEPLYQ